MQKVCNQCYQCASFGCSVKIFIRKKHFTASNLSSPGSSHVSLLFTAAEQKRLDCVFDTFVTCVDFVCNLTDADCWAQNGGIHSQVFAPFKQKTRTRKDRKINVSVLHAIFVDSTHVSASVQSPLDPCRTVEGRNTCLNLQHPQPKFESCDCKFLQDFQQQTEDSNITNTTLKSNTLSTYYYNTFLTKSNHNSIRSSNALSSFTSPLKTHLSKLPS